MIWKETIGGKQDGRSGGLVYVSKRQNVFTFKGGSKTADVDS